MSKRKFTEDEVREAVWEHEVETTQGEDRRWSRTNTTIVFMEDDKKHYSLYWEHGLTENQDHFYPEQLAPEVKLVEQEKIITVKNWVEVNDKKRRV